MNGIVRWKDPEQGVMPSWPTPLGQGIAPLFSMDPFDLMERMMRWVPRGGLASVPGGMALMPAFEIKETGAGYVVTADLPGLQEKDVDLELLGDRLTVRGQRQEEVRDEGESYYTHERRFGSFVRTFTLPQGVDADHVKADLKDGVLTIHLPKNKEAQGRKISVGGPVGGLLDRVKESVKGAFSRKEDAKKEGSA